MTPSPSPCWSLVPHHAAAAAPMKVSSPTELTGPTAVWSHYDRAGLERTLKFGARKCSDSVFAVHRLFLGHQFNECKLCQSVLLNKTVTYERRCRPANERRCRPANERRCRPADKRLCRPADKRRCRPADQRRCRPADLRRCCPPDQRRCRPANERRYRPANKGQCRPANEGRCPANSSLLSELLYCRGRRRAVSFRLSLTQLLREG